MARVLLTAGLLPLLVHVVLPCIRTVPSSTATTTTTTTTATTTTTTTTDPTNLCSTCDRSLITVDLTEDGTVEPTSDVITTDASGCSVRTFTCDSTTDGAQVVISFNNDDAGTKSGFDTVQDTVTCNSDGMADGCSVTYTCTADDPEFQSTISLDLDASGTMRQFLFFGLVFVLLNTVDTCIRTVPTPTPGPGTTCDCGATPTVDTTTDGVSSFTDINASADGCSVTYTCTATDPELQSIISFDDDTLGNTDGTPTATATLHMGTTTKRPTTTTTTPTTTTTTKATPVCNCPTPPTIDRTSASAAAFSGIVVNADCSRTYTCTRGAAQAEISFNLETAGTITSTSNSVSATLQSCDCGATPTVDTTTDGVSSFTDINASADGCSVTYTCTATDPELQSIISFDDDTLGNTDVCNCPTPPTIDRTSASAAAFSGIVVNADCSRTYT
ncbi:unnamed protein product, partial [Mesorhabditis spiculigera]